MLYGMQWPPAAPEVNSACRLAEVSVLELQATVWQLHCSLLASRVDLKSVGTLWGRCTINGRCTSVSGSEQIDLSRSLFAREEQEGRRRRWATGFSAHS